MTPIEFLDFAVAVATLLTSAGAVVIGMRNASKIQDVHVSLNSRLSQLLITTQESAKALGIETERARAAAEKNKEDESSKS